MKLWIVADMKSEDGAAWELRGVFDDEQLAIAACTKWNHCLFSTELNRVWPDETIIPADARYPIAEETHMPKVPTRHDQLIAAGWRYDANQDRYAAPGSLTDGTERWHNQAAAWSAFQATESGPPAKPAPPVGKRATDPREQEPQ